MKSDCATRCCAPPTPRACLPRHRRWPMPRGKRTPALTEEAGKRYATTESQLINLKNRALLFAQQIGDDLNPMIQNLIGGVDELLSRFLEMDEAQRMQIIRYAAIAASIGPVLLLMGKVSKGVGALSTGIGKFATAVGKAGGGWSGFLSVLTKSPAVWLAVAAAVVAGTVALVDYVLRRKTGAGSAGRHERDREEVEGHRRRNLL